MSELVAADRVSVRLIFYVFIRRFFLRRSIRVSLLDEDKTLTDKQIDKAMLRIASAFEKELGASVRGM